MKQFIFLISCGIFACLNINAQTSRYSVFSVSGQVQIKQETNWKDITKHMPLGAFDELNIPTNGLIKILENKTNNIYKSSINGITTVRQVVKDAKKQSEGSLSSLTQAFTKGMSTKPDNDTRLRSVGAAHRGTSLRCSLEDSICSTIAYTAYHLLESDLTFQDTTIIGTKIVDGESYVISLKNTSDFAYCVNIISVNIKTNTCRLMLSPGYDYNQPYVILNAHTKVILDDITFLSNPEERLLVFASDYVFDNVEVNIILENYQIPEGENLIKMKYFEIK